MKLREQDPGDNDPYADSFIQLSRVGQYFHERSSRRKWSFWKHTPEGDAFIKRYAIDYLTLSGLVTEAIPVPQPVKPCTHREKPADVAAIAGIRRPSNIKSSCINSSMEKLLKPNPGEREVPVCTNLDDTVLRGKWFITDSGASTDVLGLEDFTTLFPEFIRQTKNKLTFQTANDIVDANKGVRVRIADWDSPSDAVLMRSSPNLTSLGARCMKAGMTFIWIRGKYPCAFTEDMRLIIIFDLDGVIPVYKAELETSDSMLGTFELAMKAFKETVP